MSLWRRPTDEEAAAFETFVSSHIQSLAALARALTSSQPDADDLLQETLAKVLENWQRVASSANNEAYVRRIMVTTSTTLWRRRRHESHKTSADEVLSRGQAATPLWHLRDTDGGVAIWNDQMLIRQLLQQLPKRQRTVVVLRYLENLPDDEIADLLGIASVTVRSTALRAVRSLKRSAMLEFQDD